MNNVCRTFLLAAAIVVLTSFVALSEEKGESCFVKLVRLEGVFESAVEKDRVSVQVLVGSRLLFQTRWVDLKKAFFGNRIRFFTAKDMPIRLIVRKWTSSGTRNANADDRVESSGSNEVSTQSRDNRSILRVEEGDNDSLQMAFPALVGDMVMDDQAFEPDTPSGGNSSGPVEVTDSEVSAGREGVLCEMSIAWPPGDRTHRPGCRGAVLVVETTMIR